MNCISHLAKEQNWQRIGITTLKNDVACFIRTYISQQQSSRDGNDSSLESPLIELQLVKAVNRRNMFRFLRGPKQHWEMVFLSTQ